MPMTAALLLATAALGACAEDDPVIPPASSTSAGEPSWPVSIARTGGVAGFRDSLSVQSDGTVIGRTKQGDVRCTLEASALDALREGAAPIRDTDVPTLASTGTADHLSVLVGAGTGLTSVDDPRVAPAVPVIDQLLADVTGPAASRKICT